MVEIISFFSWYTYTRDSVGKQKKMLNQPRLASIIKQKMTFEADLGNNEKILR